MASARPSAVRVVAGRRGEELRDAGAVLAHREVEEGAVPPEEPWEEREQSLRRGESAVWAPVLGRSSEYQAAIQVGKSPAGLEAVVPRVSTEAPRVEVKESPFGPRPLAEGSRSALRPSRPSSPQTKSLLP